MRDFGECSQWGYWARMRSVEGCLQPQEFESPTLRTLTSTRKRQAYKTVNC